MSMFKESSAFRLSKLSTFALLVVFFVLLMAIYYWVNDGSTSLPMGLTLEQGRALVDDVRLLVTEQLWLALAVSLLIYTLICSVPFPFVSLVTIFIGYLFGLIQGLFVTSLGSAIGATLLFLFARRFLVGATGAALIKALIDRFPSLVALTKSQNFWVATSVRFIPGLPFFIPSLIFSATKLSTVRFFLSTQLGLFVTLTIYVNAGSRLAEVTSVGQLFSPSLIASMVAVALMPLLYRLLTLLPINGATK